jgi:hypothetical protein
MFNKPESLLKRLARNKHSSLSVRSVVGEEKPFYDTDASTDLKRFDADSLSHLHYLTNLAIQVRYNREY